MIFIITTFVIVNKEKEKDMFYQTEKIQIKYYTSKINDIPYSDNETIDVLNDNLLFKTTIVNNIISTVLNLSCQTMLEQTENDKIIIVWIDNKRFK